MLLTQPPAAAPGQTSRRAAPRDSALFEQLGLGRAYRRLHARLPTGEGVVMGHVEGSSGDYLPNTEAARFEGVRFIAESGDSGVFGHAQSTASILYGPGGLAAGVETVHAFSTSDWLAEGYLNTGRPSPPAETDVRVFTHSWIGQPQEAVAEEVLARVDHAVDAQGVVMCVGVNNGRDTSVPYLLGSAYNVIAVGKADGNSSGGYTRIATEGRCKPDLVAPKSVTSLSTPIVAGCVARLLEAADELDEHAEAAARPETIKAILLAGADKPSGWAPEPGKPLDEHLGAGLLSFDQSLWILQAGAREPGEVPGEGGWAHRGLGPEDMHGYTFRVTHPRTLSAALTWNRRVPGKEMDHPETGAPTWAYRALVADLDLRLVRMARPPLEHQVVATSESRVDNVEHIYAEALAPGTYRLEVAYHGSEVAVPWPYALAWRSGGVARR